MALFGKDRDVSLVRRLAREMVNKIIDTEIALYKPNLSLSTTNIYNESPKRSYYNPIRLNCVITRDAQTTVDTEVAIDVSRTAQFAFFKPDLIDKNIAIEVGDIIFHDNKYYEVDNISFSQEHFAGKEETTDIGHTTGNRSSFGLDISVIAEAHLTRMTSIQIEPVRTGVNTTNYTPRNI